MSAGERFGEKRGADFGDEVGPPMKKKKKKKDREIREEVFVEIIENQEPEIKAKKKKKKSKDEVRETESDITIYQTDTQHVLDLLKKEKKKKRKEKKKLEEKEDNEIHHLATENEREEFNNTAEREGKKKKKKKKKETIEIYAEEFTVKKKMKVERQDEEVDRSDEGVLQDSESTNFQTSKKKKKRKKENKENFIGEDLEKSLNTERNEVLGNNPLTPSPRKRLFTPTATPQLFDEVITFLCSKCLRWVSFAVIP